MPVVNAAQRGGSSLGTITHEYNGLWNRCFPARVEERDPYVRFQICA